MIDISTVLELFTMASQNWDRAKSELQLACLTELFRGELDWDVEAGEEWGRVLSGDAVLALVSMRGPLAVVLQHDLQLVNGALDTKFTLVPIPAMDAIAMTASAGALEMAFGTRTENLIGKTGGFSMDDLWYATVT
jgi:hypothetical protein